MMHGQKNKKKKKKKKKQKAELNWYLNLPNDNKDDDTLKSKRQGPTRHTLARATLADSIRILLIKNLLSSIRSL